MCGFSVAVKKGKIKTDIKHMTNIIHHRGPDAYGEYEDDSIKLGFKRLSIIDLSATSNQPFSIEDRAYIVFNGEIFNYLEIRKELQELGEVFKTQSDTEVVIRSYLVWGNECVKKFNGMWSLCIYDKINKKVFVSRDRYGIKPCYFFESKEGIYFFSEIKQIKAIPEIDIQENKKIIQEFLKFAYLNHSNQTFIKDVFEVEQGTNLILDLENFHISREAYFRAPTQKKPINLPHENLVESFDNLLKKSIEIRNRSDVEVASCLSGGLDSSTIVYHSKAFSNNMSTFSACFNEKKYDESENIDQFLNENKTLKSIKIFPLEGKSNLDLIKKIIYFQDQPIKSLSHLTEHYIFKSAYENNIKVLLDGQGSDEFLGGYQPFKYYNLKLLSEFNFIQFVYEILAQINKYGLIKTLRNTVGFFFKKTIHSLGFNFHQRKFFKKNIDDPLRAYENEFENNFHSRSLNYIKFTHLPYQLHSEDRNSMMFSIEARLPFLDFPLNDFIFSLPESSLLGRGLTKRILRDSMKQKLPKALIDDTVKKGYEFPEKEYLISNYVDLKEYYEKCIKENSELFSKHASKYYRLFVQKKVAYDPFIFRIISYQIWKEVFLNEVKK